jgi:hypothetical protein
MKTFDEFLEEGKKPLNTPASIAKYVKDKLEYVYKALDVPTLVDAITVLEKDKSQLSKVVKLLGFPSDPKTDDVIYKTIMSYKAKK